MWIDFIFLIVGGLFVWLGAEGMVQGAVKLAAHFGVSSLVIGLTVIAFGTSAPELVVSSIAAVKGHNEIALGNVIGSNIINITLVLGLSALIRPMKVAPKVLKFDVPLISIVTVGVVVLAVVGSQLGRVDGICLLVIFGGYMVYSFQMALRDNRRSTQEPGWERPELTSKHIMYLVGGTVLLAAGAEGMVRGAVGIAQGIGISEQLIGMTLVAFGTSVPELAASVVAARHGESDLAVGNVVGSNFFNMTLILGTASTISPIPFNIGWKSVDIGFFLLSVLILFPLIRIGWKLGRIDGAILLSLYALSIGLLFI